MEAKNTQNKDESDIYAEGWACMFRKMTQEQQLYAKQAIDEIMIAGQLNKLCMNYLHNISGTSFSRATTPYSTLFSTPRVVATPMQLSSPVIQIDSNNIEFVSTNQSAQDFQLEMCSETVDENYANIIDLFQDQQYR